jgi:hypothetical protein
MPLNTNPVFIGTRRSVGVELDNADSTNQVSLFVAGANGSLIEAIAVSSTDTAAVELDLYLYDGAASFRLGSVTVPIGAGSNGGTTSAADGLNQTELPWLRDDLTLALAAGCTLKAAAHVAITSAKLVHVTVFGGDY